MNKKVTTVKNRTSSELTIDSKELEVVSENALSTNFPTWSSRMKNFQAYVILTMNFSTLIGFGKMLGDYGIAMFIPYMMFRIFTVGISILLELFLGRYVLKNVVYTWDMCLGGRGVITVMFVLTIGSIVINLLESCYLLKYLISTFHGTLPWATCDSSWAKLNCFELGKQTSGFLKCLSNNTEEFCNSLNWETSGHQFWQENVGNPNNFLQVGYSFANLITLSILIFVITFKGIQSAEKVLTLLLFIPIILGCLNAFITFLTPGADFGLKYLLMFNSKCLIETKMWVEVYENTLSSVGLGVLSLTYVSTHGKFEDDVLKDLVVILFSDVFCTILLSIPILSIIADIKTDSFADTTERLPIFEDRLDVFVYFSEALVKYPTPTFLWALMFYLEMAVIELGTITIHSLAVGDFFIGLTKENLNNFYASIIIGVISFVVTAPFLFLDYKFLYPLHTATLVTVLLSYISLSMCYGINRLIDDFHFLMGFAPPVLFRFAGIVSFIFCVIFLVIKYRFVIPNIPIRGMVYIYSALPLAVFLLTTFILFSRLAKQGKFFDGFLPNPKWGPKNPVLHRSRIIFNSKAVTKEFMYRQELFKKPHAKPFDFSEQNIVQSI